MLGEVLRVFAPMNPPNESLRFRASKRSDVWKSDVEFPFSPPYNPKQKTKKEGEAIESRSNLKFRNLRVYLFILIDNRNILCTTLYLNTRYELAVNLYTLCVLSKTIRKNISVLIVCCNN